MPNPMRGEAKLGDRTLIFDVDAFCRLEDETGHPVHKLFAEMQGGMGVKMLRSLVMAGLKVDGDEGRAEAAALIGETGIEPAATAVAAAIEAAFPSAEGKAKPRPKRTTT